MRLTRDVEGRRARHQVSFGVVGRLQVEPHVPDDDLAETVAPLARPAGTGGEHPGEMTAGLLESHGVTVELRHQADAVEHRRREKQFGVLDALPDAQRRRPQVDAARVTQQGR